MTKGITHTNVGSDLLYEEYHDADAHTLESGTSFPGSPSEKDRFYRTDLHLEYIYDGTDWRSTMDCWSKEDSGTKSVGTSEVTFFEKTDNQERIIYINLENIADNDTFELRIYVKVKSGGNYRMITKTPYIDAQPTGKKMLMVPSLHATEFGEKVVMIKTAGTNRDFDYYVKVRP